jgi:low affinity Fe/Cu permease
MNKLHHAFTVFAKWSSRATGHPIAFALAVLTIIVWGATGPMFDFNDTWQLVINTATTIVTFLMVFLIQSTQNRDTAAMQIKLDELIRSTRGAHNALLDLEEMEEADLERLRQDYEDLAAAARRGLKEGKSDTQVRETKQQQIEELERKRQSGGK